MDWKWSERQDSNLRRLGPKPSALARLSYAPSRRRVKSLSDQTLADLIVFRNAKTKVFRN